MFSRSTISTSLKFIKGRLLKVVSYFKIPRPTIEPIYALPILWYNVDLRNYYKCKLIDINLSIDSI